MGMIDTTDEFSEYYSDYLDGTYDCADRIVLNGYFRLGCSPGGFRTWWRRLEGSDENLDKTHLMRMAGRFSRRVHAYAKKHNIPIIHCKQGQRKHEIAEQYLPKEPDFTGVFLILVGRAPAPVWEVERSKNGKILDIRRKKPYPYVNHYSFHIMDTDWGHVTIKLCGHAPFSAQIVVNGHEYVARQAKKAGVEFTKEDNCFTEVPDTARLAEIADTLYSAETIGRLIQMCERWIYSACLCFGLSLEDQERTGFHYDYSIYQAEYSRNLVFTRGSVMEEIFQGIVDRTRSRLDVKRLKTIFGAKKRPYRHKGKKSPRLEVVVERPTYDLTVFKIHFGKFTLKMYTKGEHVLRIEAIVHNVRATNWKRSLPQLPDIVSRLKEMLTRFLEVVYCVAVSYIADTTLEALPKSSRVGQARVGGIDINNPRMRAVIEAVTRFAAAPDGFRASDIATKVQEIMGYSEDTYTSRKAAYDLKKLRGKNVIRRAGKSRRYEIIPEGLRAVTALLVLRDKVIKPVLAGAGKPRGGRKPKNQSPIDAHYEAIQSQMRSLFQLIGVAA
jgi:hypothetical protein